MPAFPPEYLDDPHFFPSDSDEVVRPISGDFQAKSSACPMTACSRITISRHDDREILEACRDAASQITSLVLTSNVIRIELARASV